MDELSKLKCKMTSYVSLRQKKIGLKQVKQENNHKILQ